MGRGGKPVNRHKFTKSFVDGLKPDPDPRKRLTWWDTEVTGLGVTVTPYTTRPDGSRGGGVKSYIVQYRPGGRGTPTRRVTIGRHGWEWQVDSARREAAEILRIRRQGLDPFEERRRNRETEDAAKRDVEQAEMAAKRLAYSTFTAEFIDRYAKKNQPGSWFQTERALKDIGKQLGDCRIDRITRDEIRKALEPLTARSASAGIEANKALKKLYNWANNEEIFDWHPMRGLPAPATINPRKRVLSSSELKAVWDAAVALGYPFGFIYAGLLATGLRRSDMANLVRGEFYPSHEILLISGGRMKRKKGDDRGDFHFPLNMRALMIVETATEIAPVSQKLPEAKQPVFTAKGLRPVSGFGDAKLKIDAKIVELNKAPIPHWTPHDLRRTMSTVLQALGVDDRVIDLLQDHRIVLPSKAASHYQHWAFEEEKRAAVQLYEQYLSGAIEKDPRYEDLVRKVDYKLMVKKEVAED